MHDRRWTKVVVSMGDVVCVAGMALCDIRCVSEERCVRDHRWTNVDVSMEEATRTCLSRRVRRCAHVVLHGRRGTL